MKSMSQKKNFSTKIFIRNLPVGITSDGIRNLCLSAGQPISVYMCRNNESAYVEFTNLKEAELALRDLNNTPPYLLKVSFAKPLGEKENKVKENKCSPKIESIRSATDERWNLEIFYKCYSRDKLNQHKNLCKQPFGRIGQYFSFHSECDDASLEMRQRYLDFKTKTICVSRGRGYLNMCDIDRYKPGNSIYSLRSDDWIDNDENKKYCSACGSLTFEENAEGTEIYCSNECQNDISSFSKNLDVSNSSVFDLFAPGKLGYIKILHETLHTRFNCCIVLDCTVQYYEKVKKELRESNYERIHRAKKGDMVIVQGRNFQHFRGLVLNNEDRLHKIALVDFGETISVADVCTYVMSANLRAIPWFAGIVIWNNENFDWNSVKFRVKRKKLFDSWLCDVIEADSDNVVGEIILERWFPPVNITYVPLENKCNAIITAYKDMKTVFVRRTDSPWNEQFIRMSNDIAEYVLEGRKYKKPPSYGDICCARYKNDGCFYRAVVRSNNILSVTVDFMDYGNRQETVVEDLCYLPDAARKINSFAIRVRLKGVTEASTPETVQYLNRLTAYETELRLTHSLDNRGEVILTEKSSGDVVNQLISNMVVPVWKVNPVFRKTGEPYFLESLEELSFAVGETQDIFLLNISKMEFISSGCFWATINREDYITHLNEELKKKITEYGTFLVDDPYVPRRGELCLVELEGDWYRGVALEHEDKICDVALIDFGISCSVEPRNIRKILKQFLEMPALALKCRILGYEKWTDGDREKTMDFLLSMDKKFIKNVQVINKIDNVYNLTIPLIEEMHNRARP